MYFAATQDKRVQNTPSNSEDDTSYCDREATALHSY